MMIDVDLFKSVNDTYGHAMGDEVLIKFSETVESTLRGEDLLVRYGGEEFVILLHEVDVRQATTIAERVRGNVSELIFEEDLRVTVSIGLSMATSGDTAETVIKRADENMYAAKEQGRNRVVASAII